MQQIKPGRHSVLWAFGFGLLVSLIALVVPSTASAATEIVLVLDNSCSMVETSQFGDRRIPPADPDRLSVLATLILAQLKDDGDAFHILNFNGQGAAPTFRSLGTDKQSIRDMQYDSATLFRGVLTEATRILNASGHDRRLLVFVTDGMPSDQVTPDELVQIVGRNPTFEVLAIGFNQNRHIRKAQEAYLGGIVGDHGTFIQVADPKQLITRFTKAYAEQLGSKPVPDPDKRVGNAVLKPGGSRDVHVGRYVREVMVMAASTDRKGPFGAHLSRDGAIQPISDEGDSGCEAPPGIRYSGGMARSCRPPFNHYKVWKVPNDPASESDWKLSIDPGARSKVVFGFILRYELQAELLAAPAEVRIGESFEVRARINYKGRTFEDAEFFSADGFEATLVVGDQKVRLKRGDDSIFVGRMTATDRGSLDLQLVFENKWMHLETRSDLRVEGFLPLDLVVSPSPIDLGDWRGGHESIERCVAVDLAGSLNADKVALEIAAEILPSGFTIAVGLPDRLPGDRLVQLPLGTTRFTFCLSSPKCCSELDEAGVRITLRGQDPHYHAEARSLPLRFDVEAAGWFRCWLPVIVLIGLILLALFILYGFIRPNSFDISSRIKLSGTERGLTRAPARPLRSLPGGKRGFYRNATVGFDVSGQGRAPRKKALLRIEAVSSGEIKVVSAAGIETKNPRSRRWETLDLSDGLVYLRRRVVYRVGELLFRIE
jgi:hypothetical protein